MIFSYYFDAKKTHLLNFTSKPISLKDAGQGTTELVLLLEICEIMGGNILKKEAQQVTFNIINQSAYDIEYQRIRHHKQKKWIFTVINNTNKTQTATIGLISETVNKNPFGFDVIHNTDLFEAELYENRLTTLGKEYAPPILTQTIVSTDFSKEEKPNGFSSITGEYDSEEKNYKTKDFKQQFRESIPEGSPFKLQMNIAPLSKESLSNNRVFELTIPLLGKVSLLKNGLEYIIENGMLNDIKRIVFDQEINLNDFYQDGKMSEKSKLTIQGDGKGALKISYYGYDLEGAYDSSKSFSRVEFEGMYCGSII